MPKLLKLNLKHLLTIVFLILSISAFAQSGTKWTSPMSISISLKSDTVSSAADVLIFFKITNKSNQNQKVLVGRPSVATIGPWTTWADITPLEKNKLLQYSSRSHMNSYLSSEDELKKSFRTLYVNELISTEYKLSDIVAFFNGEKPLPKGGYELQLFYGGCSSNKVRFYVM